MLASLFIPKVLGITEFGYYQLFTFYITYTGVFHLGLNDGVYLINGGIARKDINKSEIKSQYMVGACYQLFFAAILVLVAVFGGFGEERAFIIAMTAVYLVLANATGFFGLVFQAMNETRLYSASVALDGVCMLLPLLVLLGLGNPDYRLYVVLSAFSKAVVIVFLLFHARDFIASKTLRPSRSVQLAFESIKVGVRLMFANIIGMLVIGAARFLADAHWDIDTFSVLSFALSMTMFFMTFVSQASMVLFPALRQATEDEANRFFDVASDAVDLFIPAVYIAYFPAVYLLSWWLPQYQASFLLFAHLLPLCVFDAKTDMIGATFLKVLRKESLLLGVNVLTFLIAMAGDLVAVLFFGSLDLLVIWTVVAIIVRSYLIELYLCRTFEANRGTLPYASLAIAVFFMIVTASLPDGLALAAVVVALALYGLMFRRRMASVVSYMRNWGDRS